MAIIQATTREINEAANDPDVRPAFPSIEGLIDMAGFYDNSDNVALIDEETKAVAIFVAKKPRIYDAHFLYPKTARGKTAVDLGERMLHDIFAIYNARVITGTPSRDNRAARMFAYRLGFRPTGGSFSVKGVEYVCYEVRREVWGS